LKQLCSPSAQRLTVTVVLPGHAKPTKMPPGILGLHASTDAGNAFMNSLFEPDGAWGATVETMQAGPARPLQIEGMQCVWNKLGCLATSCS
jgi:hypothetical protein